MTKIRATVTVANFGDLFDVENGRISPTEVRKLQIVDALVDPGLVTLALPARLIRQLGLMKGYGNTYGPARVTIMDRFCSVDVMEVPDDVPPLIGQIPLEMLDLVVDTRNRCLMGNPAHNGEHVLELL